MDAREEFLRENPRAPLLKLYKVRKRIIDEMPDDACAADVDKLHKISKTIETMEAKLDAVGPTLDVMEAFALFAAGAFDADEVRLIREATDKFLDHVRAEAHG